MYNADDVDELVEQLANSRVSNKHDAILTLCRDSSCQQALHVTNNIINCTRWPKIAYMTQNIGRSHLYKHQVDFNDLCDF